MHVARKRIVFALISYALVAGCAPPEEPSPAEREQELGIIQLPQFPVDAYEAELKDQLCSKVVGAAWSVYEWGAFKKGGGCGSAVLPDAFTSGAPHNANRNQDTFSMSKTLTAAAILKAMEELNDAGKSISVDSLIWPYLPASWSRGPSVVKMTFRDLMTHTSGFNDGLVNGFSPCLYDSLKAKVAAGTGNAWHTDAYANMNFCLLRVTLAYMKYPPGFLDSFEAFPGMIEDIVANYYVSYVQDEILTPVSVTADVVPTGPSPFTRYYDFLEPWQWVTDPTSDYPAHDAGASYWNLSANEYARFIAGLFTFKILRQQSLTVMTQTQQPVNTGHPQTRLGLFHFDDGFGDYYSHGGGFNQANGVGGGTVWYQLPLGVTLVVYVNSAGPDPGTAALTAYKKAMGI